MSGCDETRSHMFERAWTRSNTIVWLIWKIPWLSWRLHIRPVHYNRQNFHSYVDICTSLVFGRAQTCSDMFRHVCMTHTGISMVKLTFAHSSFLVLKRPGVEPAWGSTGLGFNRHGAEPAWGWTGLGLNHQLTYYFPLPDGEEMVYFCPAWITWSNLENTHPPIWLPVFIQRDSPGGAVGGGIPIRRSSVEIISS